MAQYFTSNELSGWPDGIQYSPAPLKVKRRREPVEATPIQHPKAVAVVVGRPAELV